MKKDIKIIGLDLDGTLYNSKKEITPHTMDVLQRAADRGILIMPTTGRPFTGFPDVLEKMPFARYALTSNGAAIYNVETKQPVYQNLIPVENALQLMQEMAKLDVMVDVYMNGYGYSDRIQLENAEHYHSSAHMVQYMRKTRIRSDNLPGDVAAAGAGVEKIVLFFPDPALRKEVWAKLEQEGKFKITYAVDYNLELNHCTANKGDALVQFGASIGIRKDQIMTCGDGGNDRDLVGKVGFGVAMGNAVDEIKQLASFISRTNDEDGVAYAIEEFVL